MVQCTGAQLCARAGHLTPDSSWADSCAPVQSISTAIVVPNYLSKLSMTPVPGGMYQHLVLNAQLRT